MYKQNDSFKNKVYWQKRKEKKRWIYNNKKHLLTEMDYNNKIYISLNIGSL